MVRSEPPAGVLINAGPWPIVVNHPSKPSEDQLRAFLYRLSRVNGQKAGEPRPRCPCGMFDADGLEEMIEHLPSDLPRRLLWYYMHGPRSADGWFASGHLHQVMPSWPMQKIEHDLQEMCSVGHLTKKMVTKNQAGVKRWKYAYTKAGIEVVALQAKNDRQELREEGVKPSYRYVQRPLVKEKTNESTNGHVDVDAKTLEALKPVPADIEKEIVERRLRRERLEEEVGQVAALLVEAEGELLAHEASVLDGHQIREMITAEISKLKRQIRDLERDLRRQTMLARSDNQKRDALRRKVVLYRKRKEEVEGQLEALLPTFPDEVPDVVLVS